MREISIGDRVVSSGSPPLVVAELSGNHNQSLERALAIIDAVAEAGAEAVKLQTYTADTMTLDIADREFFVSDPDNPWSGRTLHDLYQEAHTPWEWHPALFERARQRGLLVFSSPFDESAIDFLETLDCPAYKIASFEVTDLPLIRHAARTGKPLIISTGMASLAEIDQAVSAAREQGNENVVLLKCTSTYPADPADSHLRTIPHLREAFGTLVGLSDHTHGIGAAVGATALGASVIEKHVTLRRDDGGVDAAFSLEPPELRALVTEVDTCHASLGHVSYGGASTEQRSKRYRRSLYVARDLAAGDTLDRDCVRAVRPGLGLPPGMLDVVLGMRVAEDVKRGTPLTWGLLQHRP